MDWIVDNPDFNRLNGNLSIDIINDKLIEIEFRQYAKKYKDAAHMLTAHILKKADISKLDSYFFLLPICIDIV